MKEVSKTRWRWFDLVYVADHGTKTKETEWTTNRIFNTFYKVIGCKFCGKEIGGIVIQMYPKMWSDMKEQIVWNVRNDLS